MEQMKGANVTGTGTPAGNPGIGGGLDMEFLNTSGIDVEEIGEHIDLKAEPGLEEKIAHICLNSKAVTDIHVRAGRPITMKTPKGYIPYDGVPVTREQIEQVISMGSIGGANWKEKIVNQGGKIERAVDLSYSQFRMRVSAYLEGGEEANPNVVIRVLNKYPMPFEDLGSPRRLMTMAENGRGLLLITGPTGSGKTTTMASLLNHINMTQSKHILTIEDPIEYRYPDSKSLVSQREVGTNVPSFIDGLRGAMRQRPDIIAIGEVLDKTSVDTMLLAAESGHFVLATTHTSSPEDTINRLLSFYDTNERQAKQVALASTLVGIVSQALVPSMKMDRYYLATEVMVNTPVIATLIRKGEFHAIRGMIRQGGKDGMQDMNNELSRMVSRNDINFAAALYASNDPDGLRGA